MTPQYATSHRPRRRRLAAIAIVIMVAYGTAPIVAGASAIGDRRGPVIFPEAIHDPLYRLGWTLAGHEGKPRIAGRKTAQRPWFYGL